jgi:S1-C subfamily serine protease
MISVMKTKALILSALFCLTACATSQKSTVQRNDTSAGSVMITNVKGNHGGTGLILHSSDTESVVLTNAHVCGVVEKGGVVSGRTGKFLVSGYKVSAHHDLCLIKVETNLHHETRLADKAPLAYYDRVEVSGHPNLLPNVKTYGHFSGRDQMEVMTGMTPCTAADKSDPKKALLCFFIGGIPVVKVYQAQLVTATIMPGSSGSGAYNANGELSGVVFAGAQGLGYGWVVPYESVKNFVNSERYDLPYKTPGNTIDIFGESEQAQQSTMMEKFEKTCNSPNRAKIQDACNSLDSNLVK